MIDNRRPNGPSATRCSTWLALLLTSTLVQACGPTTTPAGPRLRVFAADVTGATKTCEAHEIAPAAGQTIEAAMTLANDGGWCGVEAHQEGPKPFEAGLLAVRPAHGSVLIHEVGDNTRIDYTPDRGFTGTDSFAVKLIPGNAEVNVAVVVTAQAK
jgi:hypothetical protein